MPPWPLGFEAKRRKKQECRHPRSWPAACVSNVDEPNLSFAFHSAAGAFASDTRKSERPCHYPKALRQDPHWPSLELSTLSLAWTPSALPAFHANYSRADTIQDVEPLQF